MSEEKTNQAALVTIEGWTLAADADEARVRDLDLADRLKYPRPRTIRDLIKRMEEDEEISDVHVRRTVRRTSMPHGGERETTVDEYWLTEEQALLVAARSGTPAAIEVRRTLVRAFIALRRGAFAVPTFDRLAFAREVAGMVITEMRALPAPSVTVNAYEADAFEEERGRTAAAAADVVLARLFVTADPAKPIGKHVASAIASQIRDFARIESAGLVPGAEGGAPAAREAIYRSLVSRAQSDMREAVRCGRAAYAKLPGVYLAPMREWLGVWGARLAREHSKPPTPAEQRTLFVVASNDSSKRGA